ncbi:MAG: hypothetical protein KTR15_13595 [Phycisphaeraceae bacterium]|nr:hypothetical protein [Phycisphaeraceae bacterium]
MGYSEFDRALLSAWHRAHEQCKDNPDELAQVLQRRQMSTYTRPLRSWSLVLRACDSRIDDNNAMGLVRMDRAEIRRLCSPVVIPEPGVSLDDAARLFGVNRTTVSRWADPPPEGQGEATKPKTWYQDVQRQITEMSDMKWPPSTYRVAGKRLMLEHFVNRADRKRSTTRVWTPSFDGLDPGGEVWSGDWGETRAGLADRVSEGFVQQLQRVDRKLGGLTSSVPTGLRVRSRVWQWVCPEVDGGCGRRVYKLYLPMPWWTMQRVFGDRAGLEAGVDPCAEAPSARFLCLRCAGLVYESAELGSTPARLKGGSRRRVDVLDRLIKRQSGGVLRRRDVFTDS